MFTSTKTILLIEREQLTVARVSRGKKPKVTKKKSFTYTDTTFGPTLKGIAKAYGKQVRIVLSDDLVYVTTIVISDQVKNERAFVYQQAQEQIPDELEKTSWDYRIKVSLPPTKTHPGYKFAQFTAIQSEFFAKLYKAVTMGRLDVESIEAVSLALSRITKRAKGTHIITYTTNQTLLIAAENGLVYTTESVYGTLTIEAISKLVSYVQGRYSTTPTAIFNNGNKPIPSIENMEVYQMPYGPLVGAALKSDIKGNNSNTLNLSLFDISKHTVSVQMPNKRHSENGDSNISPNSNSKKSKNNTKTIFVALVLFAVISISVGAIWLTFQPDETVQQEQNGVALPPSNLTPTTLPLSSTSSPTPSPTPETVDRTAYTIRVLNGTTIPSNEIIGQTFLVDEGFIVLETATANNTSALQTTIAASKSVEKSFLDELESVLSEQYDVVISDQEFENSIDVEVIIGAITK